MFNAHRASASLGQLPGGAQLQSIEGRWILRILLCLTATFNPPFDILADYVDRIGGRAGALAMERDAQGFEFERFSTVFQHQIPTCDSSSRATTPWSGSSRMMRSVERREGPLCLWESTSRPRPPDRLFCNPAVRIIPDGRGVA